MKKTEIQQRLQDIVTNFDKENFIYDFLLSFGLSKTTITRLKKGDYNLSKIEGELFYKGKIFFKSLPKGSLIDKIDELAKDEKILRQKPRFIIVTDFDPFGHTKSFHQEKSQVLLAFRYQIKSDFLDRYIYTKSCHSLTCAFLN